MSYDDDEIMLSFEPLPTTTTRATPPAPPPPLPLLPVEKNEEVEYDDFGLPVRKRSPSPVFDTDVSDSDDELPPPPAKVTEQKSGESIEVAKPAREDVSVAVAPVSVEPVQPPASSAPVVPIAEERKAEREVPTITKEEPESTQYVVPKSSHQRNNSLMSLPEEDRKDNEVRMFSEDPKDPHMPTGMGTVSEWSHQQIVPRGGRAEGKGDIVNDKKNDSEDEWQAMPAYAPYDIYDDDDRLIARAHVDSEDEEDSGAAKGYTRVYDDEDADSVTSMDENTNYLFRENEDDEAARNPLSQMKATKELLTEGQRIAYVGVCRLALIEMLRDLQRLQAKGRGAKRNVSQAVDGMIKWSQKIMVRLYTHMELSPPGTLCLRFCSSLPGNRLIGY